MGNNKFSIGETFYRVWMEGRKTYAQKYTVKRIFNSGHYECVTNKNEIKTIFYADKYIVKDRDTAIRRYCFYSGKNENNFLVDNKQKRVTPVVAKSPVKTHNPLAEFKVGEVRYVVENTAQGIKERKFYVKKILHNICAVLVEDENGRAKTVYKDSLKSLLTRGNANIKHDEYEIAGPPKTPTDNSTLETYCFNCGNLIVRRAANRCKRCGANICSKCGSCLCDYR